MIDQCINEVYKRDERVIIPDFGAIIYSEYSESADFNDLLNFDDGKVLSEIQKQHSMSEEEASEALVKYVEELKEKLNQGNSVFIGGIGYIIKDDQGAYSIQKAKPAANTLSIVEPDEIVTKTDSPESEPEDVSMENIQPEETEEVPEPEIEEENVPSSELENSFADEQREGEEEAFNDAREESEDVGSYGNTFIHGEELSLEDKESDDIYSEEDEHESEEGNKYVYEEEEKSNTSKIVLLVLIPLLLLAAGGYYFFFYKDSGASDKTQQSSTSLTKATTPKDSVKQNPKAEKEVTASMSEQEKSKTDDSISTGAPDNTPNMASVKYSVDDKKVSTTSSPSSSSSSNGRYYSLILGSFKVESNADNYQQHLQSQGLQVIKFHGKNDFYFVGFENVGSKPEAVQRLNEVQDNNPSAWIINKNLISL